MFPSNSSGYHVRNENGSKISTYTNQNSFRKYLLLFPKITIAINERVSIGIENCGTLKYHKGLTRKEIKKLLNL